MKKIFLLVCATLLLGSMVHAQGRYVGSPDGLSNYFDPNSNSYQYGRHAYGHSYTRYGQGFRNGYDGRSDYRRHSRRIYDERYPDWDGVWITYWIEYYDSYGRYITTKTFRRRSCEEMSSDLYAVGGRPGHYRYRRY